MKLAHKYKRSQRLQVMDAAQNTIFVNKDFGHNAELTESVVKLTKN